MSIYWLLALLPEWTVHTVLATGVIGLLVALFVQRIPLINAYNYLIKIVALVLIAAGLYLEGGLAYKQDQALAVAMLEKKLAEAEAKAAQTNTEIVEKIVKDTQVIHTKGKTITEYVDREVIKYNNKCELPKEVIDAHNAAATLDPSKLEGEKK